MPAWILNLGERPPATEINWEDTLGGKFALALEKLEGLLYAIYGSRPAAYNMGGTWRKCQWYDRRHPRCLWGPETWERRCFTDSYGCVSGILCNGNCYDYRQADKEYAALGEAPFGMPAPSVPIRSRSGDPSEQYRRGIHDRTYFPLGSVERDSQATFPFDPEGYGWFGATKPGRNDAGTHLWLTEANGYTWKDGQAVEFRWTKPAGVQVPTTVKIWWKRKLPGSTWSGWDSLAMAAVGDVYSATFDAQPHGTEFRWYVEYRYNEPEPDVARYDPGGAAAPADEDAYHFSWFTHWNIAYGRGLPEMLEDYGGVDVRHGTDYYQFDGSETIQPELVNLVRWILSWLGGDCCTGEYETCAETDYRSDVLHHNPRFRSNDFCCVAAPIHFRWSGSNAHPQYLTGGKGLVGGPTPDPRPVHNHPDHVPGEGQVWGNEGARKSWRGINMLYAGAEHFANFEYGGGYSWGTAPGTFVLMYDGLEDAKVWSKYPAWGLRAGDVIEAVHLREIIDAVDYLIDYGAWTTVPVCTRPRTPGTYMGEDCGRTYWATQYPLLEGESYSECAKCCLNYDTCQYEDCVPWPEPTYEECWGDCQHGKCGMVADRWAEGWWMHVAEPPDITGGSFHLTVDCGASNGSGCGQHGDCVGCDGSDTFHRQACYRHSEGLSYYVCTPPACIQGWDDTHGGLFVKARRDHVYPTNMVRTGPREHEGSGNCLGDIFACGTVYPVVGETAGLWFGMVAGIYWPGPATTWWNGCTDILGEPDCDSIAEKQALPPPLPGLGLYADDGHPLCSVCWHKAYGCPNVGVGINCGGSAAGVPTTDGHYCECALGDWPVCLGESVWVAVDLNLDGSGKPYRNFPGRAGDLLPYEGRGVPRLRDYDLTKDAATWMHGCPCETWTGAPDCA